MKILAGVDLTGSFRRASIVAFLNYNHKVIFTRKLWSDNDIVMEISRVKPTTIAIDAPLSIYKGSFRPQELRAIRDGARLIPLNTPGMKKLMERGSRIASSLLKMGFRVIETHPYSTARFLGFKNTMELARELLGFKPESKDEADAITCCITALLYEENLTVNYGGSPPFILPVKNLDVKLVFKEKLNLTYERKR